MGYTTLSASGRRGWCLRPLRENRPTKKPEDKRSGFLRGRVGWARSVLLQLENLVLDTEFLALQIGDRLVIR
jgi:hypothetical protein